MLSVHGGYGSGRVVEPTVPAQMTQHAPADRGE
jgi:hypothetical protein